MKGVTIVRLPLALHFILTVSSAYERNNGVSLNIHVEILVDKKRKQ